MKNLVSLIAVMFFGVVMFTSCHHHNIVVDPTTTIGINQQDKENLGQWVKCHTCKGDGNCSDCKGTGKRNGSACNRCDGTGKCTSCDGQGGYRAEITK